MTVLEDAEARRKAKFAVLMQVFPGDLRLCNALAMAEGVADQVPYLVTALRRDVKQFYEGVKPGADTAAGEEKLMQTVADVLAWATQLELSLHDLRKALFFRFNLRVARPGEPVQVVGDLVTAVPVAPVSPSMPPTPRLQEPATPRKPPEGTAELRQEQVAERLQGLFDGVG